MRLLLTLSLMMMGFMASAAPSTRGLTEDERDLMSSVLKSCRASVGFLDDQITHKNDGIIGTSSEEKSGSNDRMEWKHSVSSSTWQVIVAAAKKLKEKNWIVTDHEYGNGELKDRVISQQQFEEIRQESGKLMCVYMDRVPTCTKATARIARETLGVELADCGDQMPWENVQNNALRPQYQTMILGLLDLGFTYDAATGEFHEPIPDRSSDHLEFGVDGQGGGAYR